MINLWFGFPACYREDFVNCSYLQAGGPCQTVSHQKSGPLIEGVIGEEALKRSKKKPASLVARKRFDREGWPIEAREEQE